MLMFFFSKNVDYFEIKHKTWLFGVGVVPPSIRLVHIVITGAVICLYNIKIHVAFMSVNITLSTLGKCKCHLQNLNNN